MDVWCHNSSLVVLSRVLGAHGSRHSVAIHLYEFILCATPGAGAHGSRRSVAIHRQHVCQPHSYSIRTPAQTVRNWSCRLCGKQSLNTFVIGFLLSFGFQEFDCVEATTVVVVVSPHAWLWLRLCCQVMKQTEHDHSCFS